MLDNTQNNSKKVSHFLDELVEETTTITNVKDKDVSPNKTLEQEVEETEEVEEIQEEETKTPEETPEEVPTEEDDFTYAPLFQDLIDNDLLQVSEEGKEYDDTIEGVREAIDDTIKVKFQQYKDSLVNDKSKKFLEYLENGGNPDEFIERTVEFADYESLNIADEEIAKNVIYDSMIVQGFDEEDIKAQIEEFSEIGSLARNAKIAQKKMVKYVEEQTEAILAEQKAKEQERINRLQQEAESFKKMIYDSKDIAGFNLSKAQKDKFLDYMTKPIKDNTGKVYTQHILETTEEDKLKMALFKFMKFDFKEVEKNVQTKTVNELQMQLKKKTDKITTRNTAQNRENEDNIKLPDYNWLS
jgi:hypothetical protein